MSLTDGYRKKIELNYSRQFSEHTPSEPTRRTNGHLMVPYVMVSSKLYDNLTFSQRKIVDLIWYYTRAHDDGEFYATISLRQFQARGRGLTRLSSISDSIAYLIDNKIIEKVAENTHFRGGSYRIVFDTFEQNHDA